MELSNYTIEELIYMRSESRTNKDWNLSDEIRNYLDEKLVFVFDDKTGQEVYYLDDAYFNKMYYYTVDGKQLVEPRIRKIQRLHGVEFDTKRKFVEWNIKNDIKSDKGFDSWLYSTQQSKQLI